MSIILQAPTGNSTVYLEVTAIVTLMIIAIGFIIFFSYHSRKTPIMRIFGSQYFRFGIVNPAGQLTWHNRLTKDFKVVGKVILWKYKDQNYKLQEDRIFWENKIPSSIYKFGNPLALDILGIPDAEIEVWDERTKSNVKRKISSQELKGAIESKVVNELNKVGFNRMETVVLIIMIVAIGMNIVTLYQIYQINTAMATLIDQLNQILKNYVPKSPVAFIHNLTTILGELSP